MLFETHGIAEDRQQPKWLNKICYFHVTKYEAALKITRKLLINQYGTISKIYYVPKKGRCRRLVLLFKKKKKEGKEYEFTCVYRYTHICTYIKFLVMLFASWENCYLEDRAGMETFQYVLFCMF